MLLETTQTGPEVETPVTSPELETPATEIPTAANLTSHLRPGFLLDHSEEAREAAVAIQAEVSNELQGMKLPETLSESLAMLAQVQRGVPSDKRFEAIKAARLAKLAAHVHALSQGPNPPPVNHNAFWKRTPPASALARVAEMYPKAKAKRG
jgi:hypothetical protein